MHRVNSPRSTDHGFRFCPIFISSSDSDLWRLCRTCCLRMAPRAKKVKQPSPPAPTAAAAPVSAAGGVMQSILTQIGHQQKHPEPAPTPRRQAPPAAAAPAPVAPARAAPASYQGRGRGPPKKVSDADLESASKKVVLALHSSGKHASYVSSLPPISIISCSLAKSVAVPSYGAVMQQLSLLLPAGFLAGHGTLEWPLHPYLAALRESEREMEIYIQTRAAVCSYDTGHDMVWGLCLCSSVRV
jgi:hypothetical protein